MQIRFGGVLASDTRDDPLLVTELDLGGMSLRSHDSDNLAAHGSSPGVDYVAGNLVKFVLWSNRKTYQQGVQELNRFLNVWREAIYQSKTGQLIPLEYRHENDGPWQTIFGSPDFSSNSQIDEVAHHGFSQASFEFRQHLPLTYGPSRQTQVTDGEYINFILSEGPVKPVVTFHGPFTDPVLTIGNMRIGLRGSAPANDYWVVDPFARTIVDRYGRNAPARADRLTVLSRIEAEPLGHYVQLSSAPSVTIDWRPSAYNKFEGGTLVEYRWLGEPGASPAIQIIDGEIAAWNPLAGVDMNVYRFWRQVDPPPAGTHYEWEGEPHASPSIKRDHTGNIVARSLVPDPSFENGLTYWYPSPVIVGNVDVVPSDGDLWPGIKSNAVRVHVPADRTANNDVDFGNMDVEVGQWVAISAYVAQAGDQGTFQYQYRIRRSNGTWAYPASPITDIEDGTRFTTVAQVPEDSDGGFMNLRASFRDQSANENTMYATHFMVSIADSEAEALAQVATYFDGSTASDRARDLWYNSLGIPHVWINGHGWTPFGGSELGPVPAEILPLPTNTSFTGDTPDYIDRGENNGTALAE